MASNDKFLFERIRGSNSKIILKSKEEREGGVIVGKIFQTVSEVAFFLDTVTTFCVHQCDVIPLFMVNRTALFNHNQLHK